MNHGLWPLGPIAQFHLITLIFYLKIVTIDLHCLQSHVTNLFTLEPKFPLLTRRVTGGNVLTSIHGSCAVGGPIIIHGAGDGVFVFHKLQKFKSPKGGEIH